MPTDSPIARAIAALAERHNLSAELAAAAFTQVMGNQASPVQMAAFLVGLRIKGETAEEVQGAVSALRGAMVPVRLEGIERAVDTCGTGGGAITTFNISTAAAIVAAGAGAPVAKHGNRSFTSRSGSADVLEALGVAVPRGPEQAARQLGRCGMTFLLAPIFHPAMRHVGPVRRELGLTTVMNLLGPLANPAGVRRQVVGVADRPRAELVASALARLGAERAFVVHAEAGMDEIAPVGATAVWEISGHDTRRWTLDPGSWGVPKGELTELHGGDPAVNARVIVRILDGHDTGVRRSAVVINAAAALVASGLVDDWKQAVERANHAIDSGGARTVLEKLRQPLQS